MNEIDECLSQISDAGAIAGGSHDYFVTIKKANGKDDFHVHGWVAIMSKGSNTNWKLSKETIFHASVLYLNSSAFCEKS